MRFTKLHGAGNDFLIIDARETERDWPALAVAMCRRHTGAGADGLILAKPSERADLRFVLYNADGSEAETSGNGLRCFAKYAVERGLTTPRDGAVRIESLAGVSACEVRTAGGRVDSVRVSMGRPRFAPEDVPVAVEAAPPLLDLPVETAGRSLSLTCLSMGNPHAVELTEDEVEAFPLETVGPAVERHPLFPRRVNFEVARAVDRSHIDSRTWERGVGETLSCGSGASAVMVAARLHGLVDGRVELRQPGGTLVLEWDGEGEVYLSGPAVEVYEGEWREDAS